MTQQQQGSVQHTKDTDRDTATLNFDHFKIEDKGGSMLTEKTAVAKKWTDSSQELYNIEIRAEP